MIDIIFIILPLVVIGIAMIILINNVKKVNKKRKVFQDDKFNKKEGNIEEDYMAMGMSLGMCFGASIGSVLTNIFGIQSMSYGICFGMLGGMLVGMNIKKKRE